MLRDLILGREKEGYTNEVKRIFEWTTAELHMILSWVNCLFSL